MEFEKLKPINFGDKCYLKNDIEVKEILIEAGTELVAINNNNELSFQFSDGTIISSFNYYDDVDSIENFEIEKRNLQKIMELINSDDYEDYIIEKAIRSTDTLSQSKVVFTTYAKVFVPKTIHLNNEQLEEIYDLCNFSCSQPNKIMIQEGTYLGYNCYFRNPKMLLIPMKEGKMSGVVNDDFFVRKHYNLDEGYMIKNNHRTENDTWCFVTRKESLSYYQNHKYVW